MIHLLRAGAMALACVAAPLFAQTATSVPISGSVSASAATPSAGSCGFAAGTAICGPFLPSPRLPIRLLLRGGASFAGYVGTSIDNCATVNQLTAGGAAVSFAGSADEYVDVAPTTGNVGYCLVLTVSSGTENYAVRQ